MKRAISLAILFLAAAALCAQTLSFGSGDVALETSLNQINVSAKLDMPNFYAEVSLDWGIPAVSLKAAVDIGPANIYMAAAIANLAKKPFDTVVSFYKANKAKGWGYIAKQMGIKPGSAEFKKLKEMAGAKATKLKKKK